jgi:hypothetical protein
VSLSLLRLSPCVVPRCARLSRTLAASYMIYNSPANREDDGCVWSDGYLHLEVDLLYCHQCASSRAVGRILLSTLLPFPFVPTHPFSPVASHQPTNQSINLGVIRCHRAKLGYLIYAEQRNRACAHSHRASSPHSAHRSPRVLTCCIHITVIARRPCRQPRRMYARRGVHATARAKQLHRRAHKQS